jgi:hypothetical protein
MTAHADRAAEGHHRIRRREHAFKLLFAAVLVAFILQDGLTRGYGETYPGLFMPSFSGTVTDDASRIVTHTADIRVTFADGATAS